MMQNLIKILSILIVVLSSSIQAQNIKTDSIVNNLEIPDEIISNIPNSELPQFLEARQRVIDKKEAITLNAFEEIGVSKEVISRIHPSDLLGFLNERGYIEILEHEHNGNIQNHGGVPSPHEMINVLYMIILIITLLVSARMIFTHLHKRKDQDIILKALENNKEIPVDLMSSNRQRGYLNNAVLFSVIGIGIIIIGWFDILPGILSVIPLSIGLGYFLIRYLNNRSV